ASVPCAERVGVQGRFRQAPVAVSRFRVERARCPYFLRAVLDLDGSSRHPPHDRTISDWAPGHFRWISVGAIEAQSPSRGHRALLALGGRHLDSSLSADLSYGPLMRPEISAIWRRNLLVWFALTCLLLIT